MIFDRIDQRPLETLSTICGGGREPQLGARQTIHFNGMDLSDAEAMPQISPRP
jgi:hypothetical protein